MPQFSMGVKGTSSGYRVQPVSASVNEIKDGKFFTELSNDEVEEMVEKFVQAV